MGRARSGVVLLATSMLFVVAACGSGAKLKPVPLQDRVIGRGGFRGFRPGTRRTFATARDWVVAGPTVTPGEREAEIARLTGEGFKQDLTEFLTGAQGPSTGLSAVMQLGSRAAARTELAAQLRITETHTQIAERFSVKTIPGAVGYGYSSPANGGENVLFADGPFLYWVGYGWYGTAHDPRHSALIDAATKLYMRVHGHPAS